MENETKIVFLVKNVSIFIFNFDIFLNITKNYFNVLLSMKFYFLKFLALMPFLRLIGAIT